MTEFDPDADLVGGLRYNSLDRPGIYKEAADEIERLRAALLERTPADLRRMAGVPGDPKTTENP